MPSPRMSVRLLLSALTCLLLILPATPEAQESDGAAPPPADARMIFQRFLSLAGEWQASSTAGWNEVSTYEVIGRGSVVMGTTTFRDAPDRKMVTMFHLDGERLVLTHYCEARNQPHLVADRIDLERNEVVFRFAGGANIPDRDHGHMDSAVYRFLPDGSFTSRWTWYQNGEERWLEDIELDRIR